MARRRKGGSRSKNTGKKTGRVQRELSPEQEAALAERRAERATKKRIQKIAFISILALLLLIVGLVILSQPTQAEDKARKLLDHDIENIRASLSRKLTLEDNVDPQEIKDLYEEAISLLDTPLFTNPESDLYANDILAAEANVYRAKIEAFYAEYPALKEKHTASTNFMSIKTPLGTIKSVDDLDHLEKCIDNFCNNPLNPNGSIDLEAQIKYGHYSEQFRTTGRAITKEQERRAEEKLAAETGKIDKIKSKKPETKKGSSSQAAAESWGARLGKAKSLFRSTKSMSGNKDVTRRNYEQVKKELEEIIADCGDAEMTTTAEAFLTQTVEALGKL